jgi:hypothetical protein
VSAMARPRAALATAQAAFQRVTAGTARTWDDDARRAFDAEIIDPLGVALQRYLATLATLDSLLDDCLRLVGD